MKQWVIHAWDAKTPDSLNHRLEVRPYHLAGASELKRNGNFVIGGAMLDDEGRMIGSTMIVQFDTDEEFQAWVDREPYIQQGVWQDYKIYPFRVAQVE